MPVETMFHELLLTFLTAMVPVVELRGAIPVGVAAGLPPAAACAAAILGNMVPVPFILLLVRRAFAWLRDTKLLGPKIVWLERRAHLKGRLVRRYRLLGLVILVAIPLPGTGAWTGALVAALLDIRMRHAQKNRPPAAPPTRRMRFQKSWRSMYPAAVRYPITIPTAEMETVCPAWFSASQMIRWHRRSKAIPRGAPCLWTRRRRPWPTGCRTRPPAWGRAEPFGAVLPEPHPGALRYRQQHAVFLQAGHLSGAAPDGGCIADNDDGCGRKPDEKDRSAIDDDGLGPDRLRRKNG